MAEITGRALHYVFKIGNRSQNSYFFRNILGMKVLRHEEFKEGCEASCNGPYDNRWSKTMVGYGPECSHFVFELTYNYGITSYEMGNEFGGITLKSQESINRAIKHNYPMKDAENDQKLLLSPDGYKFYIIPECEPKNCDPVVEVNFHCSDITASKDYWVNLLKMKLISQDSKSILLKYKELQAGLRVTQISEAINRAKAYGRIAFAVPKAQQQGISDMITEAKCTILTPLIELGTPGKETVRVIILADPDGFEICFVDEEGFGKLSAVEENAESNLDKYIKKDPFENGSNKEKQSDKEVETK
uniref:VOC domain-containing protein n=1 Tax=Glossina brevipalpis TaxID=37001 RepID=A0A1A9W2Y5_9MUSC